MSASVPNFGEKRAGVHYVIRRGVYAVIFDSSDRVAAIRSQGTLYLPGGGCEPGETLQETLIREVREECGAEIKIGALLGEAVDYLYAASETIHFEKRGLFYRAVFLSEPVSPDLVWIAANATANTFRQQGHAWAIEKAGAATR